MQNHNPNTDETLASALDPIWIDPSLLDPALQPGLDMTGTEANDTLQGQSGSDTLKGGAGDDVLHGAAGSDVLSGGSGQDSYHFNLGDGADRITDFSGLQGEADRQVIDTLRFGAGIAMSDLTLTHIGNDLLLAHSNGSDSVLISDWFVDSANRLERVVFADGQVLSLADLAQQQIRQDGSVGNDSLNGWLGRDHLVAGDGHDVVNSREGDDLLVGGAGNAKLFGMAGSDTLSGGDGNDALVAGSGVNVLSGGRGKDQLLGGDDSDSYHFNLGDGIDIIRESAVVNASIDTLYFSADIQPGDVSLERQGAHLLLKHSNGQDAIYLEGYFAESSRRVEQIVFADGTAWSQRDIRITLKGSVEADTIRGWDGSDIIAGGAGNDSLMGGGGDDTLDGGDGDDLLIADGDGASVLKGGLGRDTLQGGSGSDVYHFELGGGIDIIRETRSASVSVRDEIHFGVGIVATDIRTVRAGAHLVLQHVNGVDSITIEGFFASHEQRIEQFVFADGTVWTQADIKITLQGSHAAEEIIGWDGDDLLLGGAGNDTLMGLGGNDTLRGGHGDDQLTASGQGNNLLEGEAGKDTLSGGAGKDTLMGGADADQYLFALGGGADVIREHVASGETSLDQIRFGVGIAVGDIRTIRQGAHLLLQHVNGVDSVTIEGFFASHEQRIEQFVFADGTIWTQADLLIVLQGGTGHDAMDGWDGRDHLLGGAGNDTLHGLGGDDTLDGGLGHDLLVSGGNGRAELTGGAGDDVLQGGAGGEVYHFAAGWGHDTLQASTSADSANDRIRFAAGLKASEIRVERAGDDLVLVHEDSHAILTIKNGFGAEQAWSGAIEFADGGVWTAESLADWVVDVQRGADEDDVLNGYDGGDLLEGWGGNDTLFGHGGNDTLRGGVGNDQLTGSYAGKTVLDGGQGSDLLLGQKGRETILFGVGSGCDVLNYGRKATTAMSANDEIVFKAGVRAEDIQVLRINNDLVLQNANGQDSLTIKDGMSGKGAWGGTVSFADGSQWPAEQMLSRAEDLTGFVIRYGTERSDHTKGEEDLMDWKRKSHIILGYQEDDWIGGGDERDKIYGGAGADRVSGWGGNDEIFGGEGDDNLNGNFGNDALFGGAGRDTISGGHGNDTLLGEAGDDLYRIRPQNDITLLEDREGNNQVELESGYAISQTWLQRKDNDLLIRNLKFSDGGVVVRDWFANDSSKMRISIVDGNKALTPQNAQILIDAMARFEPPAAGQINMSPEQQAVLQPIIARSWL